MFSLLASATIKQGDLVGFTFFIGTMAMLAATVFFLLKGLGKWQVEAFTHCIRVDNRYCSSALLLHARCLGSNRYQSD